MKTKDNSYLFLTCIILTSCINNTNGLYSHCWGDNPKRRGCHYIELNDNGTFIYSDPFFVSGNIETKGYWLVKDNKLTLSYIGHSQLDTNKSEQGYPIKEIVPIKDDTIFIHNDKLPKRTNGDY